MLDNVSLAVRGPIADTLDEIFEPIRFETLADLFSSYERDRARMVAIAGIFAGSDTPLIQHFVDANVSSDRGYIFPERLFELDPALKALDASYWSKALALTDVLESMPQKRRDEWHNLVRDHETPAFEKQTVVSSLQDLLAQRHLFFAERVDGIFRSLSREHVTNRPEGFSKRMIIGYVYNGYADVSRCGYINDLRCVVARFMGREEPRVYSTMRVVEHARRERCGQWVNLDGGSIRIRLYKKGTAHLEVHPQMAWRLNGVLASLYPNAIPEKHRRRPRRCPPKDFRLYARPLPMPVVEMLAEGRLDGRTFSFRYAAKDKGKASYVEACAVLESLGAVSRGDVFLFDYPARDVLQEVIASGVIPDQRAHQFYRTPPGLARRVVDAAQIGPEHTVLEPSAGQGALADLLPKSRTTLVEAARLHCSVLESKGFSCVLREDFLQWTPGRRFDRIVMNPPFTKNQWLHHLEHAAELLGQGGILVAVLPAGARSRRDVLPGWTCSWSETEPFPGTSIEVVILVASRS